MRIGMLVVMAAMAFCDCEGFDDDQGVEDLPGFPVDAGFPDPGPFTDGGVECGLECDPYTGECWEVPCEDPPPVEPETDAGVPAPEPETDGGAPPDEPPVDPYL